MYTAFIIFVSIIPLEDWQAPQKPFPYALLYGWQHRVFLFDIVQNLLLYIPLGFLITLIYHLENKSALRCMLASFLFALLLCTCMEIVQIYNPIRVSSLLDIALNASSGLIGSLIGFIFIATFSFWESQFRLTVKIDYPSRLLQAFAFAFMIIGVLYHLYPYVPTLHPSHLKSAIKPIREVVHHWSLFESYIFYKYALQGMFLYIISIPLLQPNRRLFILLLLITGVLLLKVTMITRYLTLESILGLIASLIVMECLIRMSKMNWIRRTRQSTQRL
ncbi:VanZ family protein [Candidatus Berkiella cookevillensis]|nr:VanZ family protein [Candidatus Berkiella cookevillensis]MCS5708188.1 VanZ family protein [Candidatus Berkiella cookevillensis]